MSSTATPASSEPMEPKQQSLLKSSMLMASGTLLSRILGFVRSALLIVAIGAFAGTANSFQVANTLPNMVYNLVAAGILDAILVPQIVRALRTRGGSPYVNKLITAVGSILFLLTIGAMVASPLLVSLFAPTLDPAARALTITFSLWCIPQIFFYGLYNLFGQVLNARGIFGPYMWAPVLNNLISITSLVAFIVVWGPAGEVLPVEDFTSDMVLLLAGATTVGVVAQALVLLIPLHKANIRLRPNFHLKGVNFGSASKVALWTFATLMVSQIGVISTTNIATRAASYTTSSGLVVPDYTAYNYAFMVFMVPQSLITVTLVTAIFTQLAKDVADQDYHGVARNYHRGVELVVMLCMVSAAILMVTATPVMQMIMPGLSSDSASLYGAVLVALMLGVPSTGIVMMSQRVFFALENAYPVFLIGIIPMILQVIVGWSIYFAASPQWWTIGAASAETVARVVQGFIALFWVSYAIKQVNARRLLRSYMRNFLAFGISALTGSGVMHFLGPGSEARSPLLRFFDSSWKVVVVASVILVVFFSILRIIDPDGTQAAVRSLLARLLPSRSAAKKEHEPSTDQIQPEETSSIEPEISSEGSVSPASEVQLEHIQDQQVITPVEHLPKRSRREKREQRKAEASALDVADWKVSPPTWEEILNPEVAGPAAARSETMPDLSSTGALPALTGAMMQAADNDDDLAKWINDYLMDPSTDTKDGSTQTP